MRRSRLVLLLCAFGAVTAALTWQALTRRGHAQDAGGFGNGEPGPGKWDGLEKAITELPPQVWVEAMFIQIDTVDLNTVKTRLENSLDPLTGTIMLAGKEKAELLSALRDRPSFEILGSASLVSIPQQSSLMQLAEEVRYPTEYEGTSSEKASDEGDTTSTGEAVVVPGAFETRETGMRLNVAADVSADNRVIALTILPEVSLPAGYMTYGSKLFSQPVFTTWDLTTTLRLNDGMTVVLTHVPTKNFEQSYLLNPQQAEGLKGKKSALLLISAKIVDPGKKQ